MTLRQISAANSSAESPAWRRMEHSVPRASYLWSGTIATRPFVLRSLTWLPRWLVRSKPALARIRTVSVPETTGSAGLTRKGEVSQ